MLLVLCNFAVVNNQPHSNQKTEKAIVLVLFIWGIFVYYLGKAHFFSHLPKPLIGLTLVSIATGLIFSFLKIPQLKKALLSIPLRYLALFSFWRIFAGLAFLANVDQLPRTFATEAGIGDIISGVLCILIFCFFPNRKGWIIFNIVGLLDLVSALGLGMYFAISNHPQMQTVTQLPFIFIILLGVPLLIFGHFVSIYKLLIWEKSTK
jgi:hypothetical protein